MDWVQLSSSLIAIVLLAFAASRMFPAPKGLSKDRVLRNYRRYAPESVADEPLISLDENSAILPVKSPENEIGILTRLGDRVVSRTLKPSTAVQWKVAGDQIVLKHDDFTQPSVTFRFSAEDMEKAQQVINMFNSTSENSHAA